ncbi:MAG: DUF3387 domain-containing protein [Candidatus Thermoplasmatota archaeon]|nr:DUF3387 domain-containing protein [Candidatus Thermoplasmatota archaeon]
MGLSEDEVAFFDALADHKNAKDVLGDDTLKTIAKELVKALRKNVTIDWTIRESVQAQMRLMIRRRSSRNITTLLMAKRRLQTLY